MEGFAKDGREKQEKRKASRHSDILVSCNRLRERKAQDPRLLGHLAAGHVLVLFTLLEVLKNSGIECGLI